MKQIEINVRTPGDPGEYPVISGTGLLDDVGSFARRVLGKTATRTVIVSNPTVFKLYGQRTTESLMRHGFTVSNVLIRDGESAKSLRTAERTLSAFAAAGLGRTDAVVALGGGVVGDLAGFAASIYLRGVRSVMAPTTLLSMVDSSVGGKTGINSGFGKNTIGAFHQPEGVLIDAGLLRTLPERELTAGACEMVKHAAISGKKLLRHTDKLLTASQFDPVALSRTDGLTELIAANIAYKASVVMSDAFESPGRTDRRSRKILNFGHTLAHALEKVTDYKYFKHGEAVGYGILFAAELSKALDFIDKSDVRLLCDVLHRAGSLPSLANIDPEKIFEAFSFDKKVIAGSLQMVLLKGIGHPVIVDSSSIPARTFRTTLEKLISLHR